MASKGNSIAERITRWDTLATNLRAGIADIPHMTDDLKALEDMLAKARALESQQEDLRSQVRKGTTTMRSLAKDGDSLRARLGANLRGKFGFTDDTLIKFGFKPRPIVRRKSKKATGATPEPTSSAPEGAGKPAAPAAKP